LYEQVLLFLQLSDGWIVLFKNLIIIHQGQVNKNFPWQSIIIFKLDGPNKQDFLENILRSCDVKENLIPTNIFSIHAFTLELFVRNIRVEVHLLD